jgi:isoquinoline 1-oxidoreductase alpha subunit
MPYTLTVNGKRETVDVPADMPLLWVLRDVLDLKGPKFGCGIAQCGACTVHLNGVATRSCDLPIATVAGKTVTTIEGLSADGSHPLQKAWAEMDVPQCGYCQAGQIMSAAALLKTTPQPNFVPCRSSTSRRTHRSGMSAGTSTVRDLPLTVKV